LFRSIMLGHRAATSCSNTVTTTVALRRMACGTTEYTE